MKLTLAMLMLVVASALGQGGSYPYNPRDPHGVPYNPYESPSLHSNYYYTPPGGPVFIIPPQ